MKIAYITELFDCNSTYRENVMCNYFEETNIEHDIFYAIGQESQATKTKCSQINLLGLTIFFSKKYLFQKYDLIIIHDLRQVSSILFIFSKLFSKSRIIIEHEQRSWGLSVKGYLLSILSYPFILISFLRANLIRSPNSYSTRFLRFFPFIKNKIIELPLAIMDLHLEPLKNFDMTEPEYYQLFTSGKRFYEKGGYLLLRFITDHIEYKLLIITDDELKIEEPRVEYTSSLLKQNDFQKRLSESDLAIYLSPTQSFYDAAGFGARCLVADSALPKCSDINLDNFHAVNFQHDKQGNVLINDHNYNLLKKNITSIVEDRFIQSLSPSYYNFHAADLWKIYINA